MLGTGEQKMELNRENIIKALECCAEAYDCFTCDIYKRGCIGGFRAGMAKNALSLIKELTEENERLRAAIPLWAKQCVELTERCMQLRADTVREMQERLKAEMSFGRYIQAYQIDQIAEEMLNDGN
jgi:hypothetical protein